MTDHIPSPRTCWAAYIAVPAYGCNGITLHATEEEAITAVVEAMDADTDEDDDNRPAEGASVEDLRDWLDEQADSRLDWYVDQVVIPPMTETA